MSQPEAGPDLGIWRCREDFVLRIHGSEHLLTPSELDTILGFAASVASGEVEALSPHYVELCRAAEARSANAPLRLKDVVLNLASLGIAPSRTFRRPPRQEPAS